MEIYLLFLFFLFAIILSLIAYLFEARPIMLGSAIILILLSFLVLSEGYSTEVTSTATSSIGYIYNETSNSHLPSQINLTNTQLYQKTQNNFSNAFGLILLGFGAGAGFLSIRG